MQTGSATSPQRAGASALAHDVPLFHAAWLFAAGVLIAHFASLAPGSLMISVGVLTLLCSVAAWQGASTQRLARLPMAMLWCLLGAWCAEMQPQPAPNPTLRSLSDGLLRTVEGTVMNAGPVRVEGNQSIGERAENSASQRIDVRLSSIEVVDDAQDQQVPASGGVRLTVHWPSKQNPSTAESFACGDQVRAVVRLLPPETYRDPGAFDRAEFLLDQGITSTASVNVVRVERSHSSASMTFDCRLSAMQRAASDRLLLLPAAMRRLPGFLRLDQDDAVMLSAMVTGDRTFLSHSLRVGFERTGSFHMLVISGFHLAIVAGFLLWTARKLHIPRVPATLLTIGASFAYALFTGFATPVQRSLWMVTLYLLSRLLYRERNILNTIGFAALCLLAVSPRSLFESSFQMTLLAVVSIGGIAVPVLAATIHPYLEATRDLRVLTIDVKLAPRIAQFRVVLRMFVGRLQACTRSAWGWKVFPWSVGFILQAGELLVVSCVVELAMTLPMAIYFHRLTLMALPVNLLILPLLLLLMPAALLTLIALLVWPAAAVVPAMIAATLLHLGVGLVHLFGSLAWSDIRIPTPLLWQTMAFCILLGAAVFFAHTEHRFARTAAVAALMAAALVAVAPRRVDHPRDALLVEAIDVGQGDSLLLIAPDGKTLLVDGGGFGGGPLQAPQEFDIGEEVVSAALWARGIRHLDVVALTHAHSDHMGGLPSVLRNFHPDELWIGKNPSFPEYNALLAEASALHAKLRALRAGDALELGDLHVNVLAPFADYQPGAEPSNNDSLVLHVAYRETSVLLEGDAEAPIEQAMLAEPGLESTLLKVGHHGSVTSTRPDFLARVAPQWAVISCGLHNRYGHPRQEVLQALEQARVHTFSTDIDGITCFRLDGKSLTAQPWCGLNSSH